MSDWKVIKETSPALVDLKDTLTILHAGKMTTSSVKEAQMKELSKRVALWTSPFLITLMIFLEWYLKRKLLLFINLSIKEKPYPNWVSGSYLVSSLLSNLHSNGNENYSFCKCVIHLLYIFLLPSSKQQRQLTKTRPFKGKFLLLFFFLPYFNSPHVTAAIS